MSHLWPLALVVLGAAAAGGADACRAPQSPAPPSGGGAVAVGQWGGAHARLTVTSNSAALELDCAHGTLDQPLMLDPSGHFSVTGTFTREGGPVRSDRPPESAPARYEGTVRNHAMELKVFLGDGPDVASTFSLVFGEQARLWKCL